MKKYVIIIFILCFVSLSGFAFEDAKGIAMGGNLIALSEGAIANWYNPARLSVDDKNDIVISYQNPYDTANLTSLKIGYKQSLNFFAFGLFFDSLNAANVYGDTKIGLNFSKRFDAVLRKTSVLIGGGSILRLKYINSAVKHTYHYVSPDVGCNILYQATTKVQLNLAGDVQYDTKLNDINLSLGLGVKLRKMGQFNLGANIFEKKYSVGMESPLFYNFLYLRVGVSAVQPSQEMSFSYSTGTGLSFDNFTVNLTYTFNQILGGYGIASIRFIL